jgi:hypothetical protein
LVRTGEIQTACSEWRALQSSFPQECPGRKQKGVSQQILTVLLRLRTLVIGLHSQTPRFDRNGARSFPAGRFLEKSLIRAKTLRTVRYGATVGPQGGDDRSSLLAEESVFLRLQTLVSNADRLPAREDEFLPRSGLTM